MTSNWKSNNKHYICEVNNPTMSEEKIISLEKHIEVIGDHLSSMYKHLDTLIGAIDSNFQDIKDKIDSLEAKIDNLDNNTDKNFKDVKWELKKIQDVTQYADIHANFPPSGQA